ncbi:MAG: FAD-dependent oxidoreductase [Bacillota bacterium]
MGAAFQPFRLGPVTLRNRVVMPAMTTRLAAADGSVTDELVAYYEARARGGAGLITVEMASPDPGGRHREREVGVCDDRYVNGLARLVRVLKQHGSAVFVQLGHAGSRSPADVCGGDPVGPSLVTHRVLEKGWHVVRARALNVREIEMLADSFARAAVRARQAGFDGVEIHAGHGYLLGQFLSPLDNHRTDAYGGSLENRARFVLEVLARCRESLGPDFPIVLRITADEFAPGGITLPEAINVCVWAADAGASAIHVSAGSYNSPSPHAMTPPMTSPYGTFVSFAREVKKAVRVPVIAVGRIHRPELADEIIERGWADLIAVGRALIADPEWPLKAQAGAWEDIRPCLSCNRCREEMMAGQIRCSVNPWVGRERGWCPRPAECARRILVVGGGPAGLELARSLALKGHRVELWERRPELGGQLLLAARAPMFQNVEADEETIRGFVLWLVRRVRAEGVKVRTGTAGTTANIRAAQPEVVVVATGARHRFPLWFLLPGLLRSRIAKNRLVRRLLAHGRVKELLLRGLRVAQGSRLAGRLRAEGMEVHLVGDSVVPGDLASAVEGAAQLAVRL